MWDVVMLSGAEASSQGVPRRSCENSALSFPRFSARGEQEPRPPGCHVARSRRRSRNISRGTSAYPRRSPERVRASPFSFPYAA